MKKSNLLLIAFLFVFIFACSSGSDDDPGGNPPGNDVTYTINVKPIIDSRCISCHSNPPTNNAPMSLVTYNNVRSAVTGRDLIGTVESGAMPPTGADLSNAQIQILKDWQEGGFKE